MTFAGRGVRSVAGLLLAILCLALPASATPKAFGQADTAWHTGELDKAMATVTDALRPWVLDFHVAQNDATVFGSGSHDKTGRHCLPKDPNGKLDIAHHAGF